MTYYCIRNARRSIYAGTQRVVRVAVALLAVLSLTVGSVGAAGAQESPSISFPEKAVSIAIIPFMDMSEELSDDWIGNGIAESLSADLEARGARTVVGRPLTSDVDWLVTGWYQREGDQVHITSRLEEVETGTVVRSIRVDGGLAELFKLQDQTFNGLFSGAMPETLSPITRRQASGGGVIFGGSGKQLDVSEMPIATSSGASGLIPGPTVRATRTDEPPNLDGILDDSVWVNAVSITDFVQQQPLDGAPASEKTEVFVAYDSEHIYFGVYAHYSSPELVRANRSDRDETVSDDTVAFYFDPFLDQQRAYIFGVNGYGIQSDSLIDTSSRGGPNPGGGGGGANRQGGGSGLPSGMQGGPAAALTTAMGGLPRGDSSWDALYRSSGRIVADGWTAELAIPFKSLRYPGREGASGHRWGLQIARTIASKDETDVWAPVSRDVAGFLTQMGTLEGLSNLSTSRNIEFLPTFTAIQFGGLNLDAGTFDEDVQPEGALNMKYGITPNLTLDFTYNPDYSQIESDDPQIEVNQRFPLFFPELRPFFLEGQELFNVGGPATLVHTRTIVDPRYGGKITGKVGDVAVGVLFANDEAPGKTDDRNDPAYGKTAQFFMGRARYDLYAESHIGVVVTDREFLDRYSRVAGVDGRFRLGRQSALNFQFIGAQHRDEVGVERTAPLFQVGYESSGRNLSYGVTVDSVHPDFRTDSGFVRRVDTQTARANMSYRWWPQSWVINWGPRVNYTRIYDFDGILQDEQASLGVNGFFAKGVLANVEVHRSMERFGGIEFYKTRFTSGGGVSASRSVTAGWYVGFGDQVLFSDTPFLGRSVEMMLFATVRPISRLSSQVLVISSRFRDPIVDDLLFNVKMFRAFTTYQLTNRIQIRNITDYNTQSRTLGANILFTYRVNSGTVFYLGYDDRFQQGDLIDEIAFPTTQFKRTNRAFFTKLSYLFRL